MPLGRFFKIKSGRNYRSQPHSYRRFTNCAPNITWVTDCYLDEKHQKNEQKLTDVFNHILSLVPHDDGLSQIRASRRDTLTKDIRDIECE